MVPDGSIRVLDLGIAKTLRANRALTVNFWASAPYASPERLRTAASGSATTCGRWG